MDSPPRRQTSGQIGNGPCPRQALRRFSARQRFENTKSCLDVLNDFALDGGRFVDRRIEDRPNGPRRSTQSHLIAFAIHQKFLQIEKVFI